MLNIVTKTVAIAIDKLTFKSNLKNICKKSNKKKNWKYAFHINNSMKKLCWIFHCISIFILLSSWIFTSKALNKTMERVHEKALTSVLNDHESTLMESLTCSKKKNAHQLYIDRLLIEVYKFLNATTLIYTFVFF